MNVNTIAVCGAGTMGAGIAQSAAQAGIFTLLYDLNPAVLENAKTGIRKNLAGLKAKGKIDGEQEDRIWNLLQFTGDIQTCIADFFIEAIIEKPELKIALFNQLAEINHGEAVFATNTSSLSITAIAAQVREPGRVIGMHFFNPATIMKLVEIITTATTNPATLEATVSLARQMGKVPVLCKDSPGFIVNRVARPYYIESLRLVEEGAAGMEQIDALMEATGFKMGPFKLMDLIGNDVNFAVSHSIYEQLNHPERLKPSAIQEEKVKQGKLGRKTGEGYYQYEKGKD